MQSFHGSFRGEIDVAEKKEQTKAGATELAEDDLEAVQGGLLAHELTHVKGKTVGTVTLPDAQERGGKG